ncbi:protein ybeL [Salmonella enterica subsp. enterica]|uniref:Protein ybeL n=1 Tax=Salmonella enterica I TaxID=59201 RepID=A0A447MW35_SALET|nr:protein ybeL [Salmonella enterica subsp. enterica]
MNKVAQYYRELVASLSERLRNGERDIDALVEQARQRVMQTGELTRTEVDELTRAVRRDLEEFAMSYEESQEDSVFLRVIKESLWQELADITDKTQLEWREVFQDFESPRRVSQWRSGGVGESGVREMPLSSGGFTRRMCCRSARSVATISSSAGRLSRKVHYRERTVAVRHVKRVVGLPVCGSLRRRSICPWAVLF